MNTFPLFICKSNANISPVAESFFTDRHGVGSCLSIAGHADKRKEYNNRVHPNVINWMNATYQRDLSDYRIRCLSEIPESIIERVNQVVVLYNPDQETACSDFCKYMDRSPIEYFKQKGVPTSYFEIPRIHEDYSTFLEASKRIREIAYKI